VPDNDEPDLPKRLARQLGECRQRGIERLYVATYRQRPLALPDLERLADDYATVTDFPGRGPIPQIKVLLLDALATLQNGNADDANLIRDLFFGDDTGRIRRSAGELLKRAQTRYGEPSDDRFREIRSAALRSFATFLIEFVAAPTPPSPPAPPSPSATAWQVEVDPAPLEVVLRFSLRDPGYSGKLTIEEHVNIITARGRCWWGWFRWVGEIDHSEEIEQRLGHGDVGLWARSENLFYVASCDAVFTSHGEQVRSPEPGLTPEYYRTEPYPAWFRFRSIRKASPEEFEYRFGDLPDSPETLYWSPEEVQDPVIVEARGSAILHLSDLRFGDHHRWRSESAPRRSHMTANQAIAQTLLSNDVGLAAVGVVAICGNFVSEQPTPEAYRDALAFIDGLCEQLPNVERDHVVVVPGADDFARPGDRERTGQILFRRFHQRLYGGTERNLSRMRRYEFGNFRLNVLPVNSVKYLGVDQRDEGMFGSGYDSQLSMMRQDYWNNNESVRVINAIAAHHHLISTPVLLPEAAPQEPVQDTVMPGIRDARDVLGKLSSSRVALFLHGHLHEADSYTVISDGWHTAVCCAGTSGASDGWLRSRYRDNQGNSLAVYSVEDGRIGGRMIVYDERIRRSPQPVVSFVLQDQQSRISSAGGRAR
jgi:3',5'-cyclic AMP phosphodiesterase CpdA